MGLSLLSVIVLFLLRPVLKRRKEFSVPSKNLLRRSFKPRDCGPATVLLSALAKIPQMRVNRIALVNPAILYRMDQNAGSDVAMEQKPQIDELSNSVKKEANDDQVCFSDIKYC
ncbi:hypothetical protein OESDEN_24723 [Oesophagostomum dentatum]|uniref:Uncharacterized protein n=1 Tax=Oesophagostomum dentatum TaxID=61180 RepID=A0A0B1RVL3_OESDE|nr:hypothetical protein OESDEN_24723 [Oesophagostomum dentatum]